MDARTAPPPLGPDRMPMRHRVPAWVWDVLVVGFSLVGAFAPYRDPGARAHASLPDLPGVALPVLLYVVVGLQAGALLLRRRLPLAVFVGESVLLLVGSALAGVGMPFAIPVALAVYGLAKRRPRRVGLIAVGSVVVAYVVVEYATGNAVGLDPRVFPGPVIIAFAGAAGDGNRSRRAYVAMLAERAERAEATRESEAKRRVAEERLRIAQDLHDAVAHEVAVVNLQAGVAARAIAPDREPDLPRAREAVDTVGRAARGVLEQIGTLLSALRADSAGGSAPTGPMPGLGALDELVADFAESGLQVGVRREGRSASVPADVDRVAYLVVREALTNAHKHGAEHRAHVLVEQDDASLELSVVNPVGPDRSGGAPSGYGLVGLRERVGGVGGVLIAERDGGVFRLRVRVPLGGGAGHPGTDESGEVVG
ncbi:sensor histidine kinase [Agromyces seonyuensis]|uniref:histidine kinase n=1 Tax=Agromyces seonyuensis TaxID=2662446 RepID=A0A6I4NVJ2_9MICO|nr:histidine kinase [Agromyces seonyuensis]MWB97122.1 sensor histidine kinase [Agromyces seonyuensis]